MKEGIKLESYRMGFNDFGGALVIGSNRSVKLNFYMAGFFYNFDN